MGAGDLAVGMPAVVAGYAGDLLQIPHSTGRQECRWWGDRNHLARAWFEGASVLFGQASHHLVQRVDPWVVPLTGDGGVHRNVFVGGIERPVVSLPLLANVAQRIRRAASVRLVEHDHIRQVQHVDLLELRRRPVIRRHHVDRGIGQVDDLGVALSDSGGLDHDQVEAVSPEHRDRVVRRL